MTIATRKTSANVWVRGNRKLRYFPSANEFAGEMEGGWLNPIGVFRLTENNREIDQLSVYDTYGRKNVIQTFTESGNLE